VNPTRDSPWRNPPPSCTGTSITRPRASETTRLRPPWHQTGVWVMGVSLVCATQPSAREGRLSAEVHGVLG
jgi:hypothetical protein